MDLPTTAQPLALIKKTPLVPSLTSMTKSFLAKTFLSPHMKRWGGGQSSPTGVDSDLRGPSIGAADGRGDICEIVVVAIQKVTLLASDGTLDARSRLSTSGARRRPPSSSVWGAPTQLSTQLPSRLICTIRSGGTTKVSAQSERTDVCAFVFDEKFVFERRELDAQYHNVTIDVSSAPSGFSKKHSCLGRVQVDLDAAFAAQATGPIYRRCALTAADGAAMDVDIQFVLHRLVVQNATAAAASRVLTRSSGSLNDDDDMDACGQIFPDLWYLC
ncbi:unnamed protein product [Hyaloperonospora brassicae]|uniref:C2 NT-type domain-containing protein n=1 Tax=Hyaloperonospora brassicae TaxID=162125 RepID=A0AAV0U839_HYABA|nr:unnamed protein product [Hyaloperonospora brassicae]